jgi:hypothetical protein
MNTAKILITLFVPVFLSALLSGCYIPIRFDAEIELHRTSAYDFKFDGYLASVELYKGLKEGKIDAATEREKSEIIKTDFKRDPSVKEFKYFKQGHFKVNWHRNGDLIRSKSVSFSLIPPANTSSECATTRKPAASPCRQSRWRSRQKRNF